MKYRDLNASPSKSLEEIVKGLKSTGVQGATGAHGVKHMGLTGDSVWYRPDGTEHSVRDIDDDLADAQIRIDDAEAALADSQVRLEGAEEAVSQAQAGLDRVETEVIPGAVADLEAADQAAQAELGELDTRLTSIDAVGTGELASIRDALTAAQDAVDAAQQVATEANTAANAASQAALEAAGIAASKGRVIVSETEPTGEDRKASNIWIRPVPDDPDTDVEEKAVTYVFIEASNEWQPTTSSELAQAAQNALDAREAAQQAQQRADTAVANASAAQSAAEDAQRTADQATLDARSAHNDAVAAQETADSAMRSAASSNLLVNGGFEEQTEGHPDGWALDSHHVYQEVPSSRTGWGLRMDPGRATGTEVAHSVDVSPGRIYRIGGWLNIPAGTVVGGASYNKIRVSSGGAFLWAVDFPSAPTESWVKVERDGTFDVGSIDLQVYSDLSDGPAWIDDIFIYDVTEAVAAQRAADDAQARADEAYDEAAKKLDEDQVDAKITASANGKNSITVSTSAPSGSGVALGDTWWRVDASGNIFGQWMWGASGWTPRAIRSEVIANLDVHKLTGTSGEFETFFAENFTANDAVVEHLWTDQLVGKTATFNRLTVAPGNLWPDPYFQQESMWAFVGGRIVEDSNFPNGTGAKLTPETASSYGYFGGSQGRHVALEPGARYRVRMTARFGGNSDMTYGRIYVRGMTASGEEFVVNSDFSRTSANSYAYGPAEVEFTAPADLVGLATVAPWAPHTPGGELRVGGIEMVRVIGAVLIEDGAITAPKITFTEELSGNVASFMSTESKKLIVSEEAILNHATLIGKTVVDDINVQGKLIGRDGVFTGTVDFENVNVTGTQIVNKIEAGSISASQIKGGSFSGETFMGGVFKGAEFQAPENPRWNGGIAIDPTNGLRAWSSDGPQTLQIDPTTGDLRMMAGGAYFTGSNRDGLALNPPSKIGTASIYFTKGGNLDGNDAAIWRLGYDSGRSPLLLRGGNGAGITVNGDSNSFTGDVNVDGDLMGSRLWTTEWIRGYGYQKGEIRLRNDGAPQLASKTIYDRTYSSSANVVVTGFGTLGRSTSSRRYKRNITNWSPDAERVLALQPRQWQHDDPEHNPEIDETWQVGFIAEEVHDLGLRGLVDYAGDGWGGWRPESLRYDRFAAAHQVVLQKHEAEIKELRERIAELSGE